MKDVINFIRNNMEDYINELKEFLKIPSISTLPEYKNEIEHCAKFVAENLEKIGLPVEKSDNKIKDFFRFDNWLLWIGGAIVLVLLAIAFVMFLPGRRSSPRKSLDSFNKSAGNKPAGAVRPGLNQEFRRTSPNVINLKDLNKNKK